ncbi:alpha/beta fold hydrolase [Microbacterium sp. Yaish 1]|uniref:alpha/beta fold hydrolase n=1 Tax=Microbacterium sp. Yaish 1 TaxID=2025014 RepID=UPI001C52ECCD|nr:alpha/beta hydrolase [Microbacterium sp. Yaish 1]
MTFWEALADLPHRLHYVDVGPWRTRVLDVGTGDEVVVLANGTSGHIEAWTQNVRALVEGGYRVVGYDYPGHGYTTLTERDLEIADYESHLAGLLDALGLARVHLAGESLGGWLAVKFAIGRRDRVRSLVLSAPGGRVVGDQRVDKAQSVSRAAVTDPTYENVERRLRVVIHDPEMITGELVRVRQAIYRRDPDGANMAHISVLRQPEVRWRNRLTDEDLGAIDVPVLFIWTDHEPTGDAAEGARLASLIPRGEFLLAEGAAHWPQWEAAELVNAAMVAFLARHGGDA